MEEPSDRLKQLLYGYENLTEIGIRMIAGSHKAVPPEIWQNPGSSRRVSQNIEPNSNRTPSPGRRSPPRENVPQGLTEDEEEPPRDFNRNTSSAKEKLPAYMIGIATGDGMENERRGNKRSKRYRWSTPTSQVLFFNDYLMEGEDVGNFEQLRRKFKYWARSGFKGLDSDLNYAQRHGNGLESPEVCVAGTLALATFFYQEPNRLADTIYMLAQTLLAPEIVPDSAPPLIFVGLLIGELLSKAPGDDIRSHDWKTTLSECLEMALDLTNTKDGHYRSNLARLCLIDTKNSQDLGSTVLDGIDRTTN